MYIQEKKKKITHEQTHDLLPEYDCICRALDLDAITNYCKTNNVGLREYCREEWRKLYKTINDAGQIWLMQNPAMMQLQFRTLDRTEVLTIIRPLPKFVGYYSEMAEAEAKKEKEAVKQIGSNQKLLPGYINDD